MAQDGWGTDPLRPLVYPKAHVLNRFIAKSVDVLIISAATQIAYPAGWLAGLVYILISDGLPGGRSIGKRLAGLQTIIPRTREAAGFRESIIRNLPFGCAYVLFPIPILGWGAALLVAGFEALLIMGNEQGLRIGDDLGQTQVLDFGQLEISD